MTKQLRVILDKKLFYWNLICKAVERETDKFYR